MNHTDLFGSIFLFNGTDFSEIDNKYSLSDSILTHTFGDGEKIICDGLPVISSGSAFIVSCEGEHKTILKRLSPGDTFGAATLFFCGEHRTFVLSDCECTILYIPTKMLKTLIENESKCALNYISFLSERIAFLNRKISAFTASSSDAKLSLYLSGLPENDGFAYIPVSLTELSNMLGEGRASLYRSFDTLSDAGIIEKDGKRIKILDRERLENFNM